MTKELVIMIYSSLFISNLQIENLIDNVKDNTLVSKEIVQQIVAKDTSWEPCIMPNPCMN